MTKLTRRQLYEEIWESSASQVADKYGLNYQKLLKQCKEINIPLPGRKYLYNKRHGLEIEGLIVPLPDSEIVDVEVENLTSRSYTKNTLVKQEITTDTDIEFNTGKILFDKAAIISSLNFLDEDKRNTIVEVLSKTKAKEGKKLHKKVAAYKERVTTWNKRVKAAERQYYDPRYQRNDLTEPPFIKEVSKEQLPRLYRLLDTLCTIFESIGEKITDDFKIQIDKDSVSFEVIESTDKIEHEITKDEAQQLVEYNDRVKRNSWASKPRIRKYDYIPNGLFRIKLSNGKYIKDTKSSQLEEVIPDIIVLFYQCYYEARTWREKWEEEERIREEEKQKARKLQERIDEEKQKTKELLNIVSDYKLADEIRNFVEVIKTSGNVASETIEWMLKKADWIDPVVSAKDELLGEREHQNSEEEKEESLEEKGYYW